MGLVSRINYQILGVNFRVKEKHNMNKLLHSTKVFKKIPPVKDKSSANLVAVAVAAPFLAGKGGGDSDDSSCRVLPFFAGSKGGISHCSASVFSLESALKMSNQQIRLKDIDSKYNTITRAKQWY